MATPSKGIDGQPILLDSSKIIEVLPDGTVLQDGQEVSRIAVVDFEDPKVLAKRGGNYFRSSVQHEPRLRPSKRRSGRANWRRATRIRPTQRRVW